MASLVNISLWHGACQDVQMDSIQNSCPPTASSVLDGNGLRPIEFPKGPISQRGPLKEEAFKPSDDKPEPESVANTFWAPNVKGVNGFEQYYWHPREEIRCWTRGFVPSM